MLRDALKIKDIEVKFIDAYAMKYPVRISKGPFLFVNNNNLQKFIKDNNLNNISKEFDDQIFKKNSISRYCFQLQNILFRKKMFLKISNNQDAYEYFSPYHINNWIENYANFELIGNYIYEIYESLNSFLTINDAKYTNFLNTFKLFFSGIISNIYLYQIHFSNLGWSKETVFENICGFPNHNYTIEAIKIISLNNDEIFYKCCYEDKKWSNFCTNGEICGTTGKHKPIHGFIIESKKFNISYQLFAKHSGWTKLLKNGEIAFSKFGFTALIIRVERKKLFK